jgi:hypothetical protein
VIHRAAYFLPSEGLVVGRLETGPGISLAIPQGYYSIPLKACSNRGILRMCIEGRYLPLIALQAVDNRGFKKMGRERAVSWKELSRLAIGEIRSRHHLH